MNDFMKNTMINYRQKTADWSDLPKELVIDIATRLTRLEDRSRFRAVCHHWRSSVPPLNIKPNLLAPPSQILTAIAVFLVQPLDSSSKGCISTFAQLDSGKLRLLHPLYRIPKQKSIYIAIPKSMDLRDFNVTLIAQSFIIKDWFRHSRKMLSNALKLQVVHRYQVDSIDDDGGGGGGGTLMVLSKQGCLYSFILTPMDIRVVSIVLNDCDDIIVFKGIMYALDHNGKARAMVSTTKEDNHYVSIPKCEGFTSTWRRRLVESDGDLYLVSLVCSSPESGCFRVYKLNEDQRRWDEISNLGDSTLFMSYDFGFFVSAREVQGCEPNCIVYQSNCFDRPGGTQIPEDDLATKRLQIGVLLPKDL